MAQALKLLLACLIVGPCLAFLPQEKVGIPAGGVALALPAAMKSWVGAGAKPKPTIEGTKSFLHSCLSNSGEKT